VADADYTIRNATVADADAVGRLWEVMAAQHRGYDADVWCWSDNAARRWRDDFAGYVERGELLSLVAEMPDGELIGFATVEIKASEPVFATETNAFVWELVVSPDHRRNDVGTKLMARVFDELKRREVDDVILHASVDNAAALSLYEGLGMRRVMVRMYKRL
jgi:ribosomal protein S18 acetylase RimI-like enzyme